MKILLDTHVIIWMLTDDPRLSKSARVMIENPDNIIYYSTASIWEIAIKNFKSPEKCPYNEEQIADLCVRSGYEPLDIKAEHISYIRTLKINKEKELKNYDPFDRMLIAQAKAEGMILISHDFNFCNYSEKCIRMI